MVRLQYITRSYDMKDATKNQIWDFVLFAFMMISIYTALSTRCAVTGACELASPDLFNWASTQYKELVVTPPTETTSPR